MDAKIQTELEKAKEYFYQWRLTEAYAILRRHFDRLPFKPEPSHAEYIGMFVRTLFELGKNRELQFYLNSLETLYEKTGAPEIGYQLAYIYIDEASPRLKTAQAILEKIIGNSRVARFEAKAKLLLAYCYSVANNDTASVKKIVDSIQLPTSDASTDNLVITWKAKVLKEEGKVREAESLLLELMDRVSFEKCWYSNFIARILLSHIYLDEKDFIKARKVVEECLVIAEGRPLKSTRRQIEWVKDKLNALSSSDAISVCNTDGTLSVEVNGQKSILTGENINERLFTAFIRNKTLTKENIAELAIGREYRQSTDDAVIYSVIHSLRKYTKKMGLSEDAIAHERDFYRLVPEVKEIVREL